MSRLYASYVDKMAADAGWMAFAKWLAVSVAAQFVTTFLCVPVVLLAQLAPDPMKETANVYAFLLCFFAMRVVICVIPAARVAERKGRTPGWLWGALAFCFGQFALAAVAALPARAAKA